jgi:hypothetical protein
MDINLPDVKAEVEAAHARYEQALVSNDVAALQALFWNNPLTIRYGINEILHGWEEIGAFRAARSPANLARTLDRTVVTTYGRCFGASIRPERWGGRCRPGRGYRRGGASSRRM